MIEVSTKELAQYKEQVLEVQQNANSFEIRSQNDLEKGADILKRIKDIKKIITERREEITRPIMQSLSSIRDLFKPMELGYAEAEKILKAKILAFQISEEERIKAEEEAINKKVEAGRMRADTAAEKLSNMDVVPIKVQGSVGKVSTRTITKVRVVDESIIPREYLVPDLTKIADAILHNNQTVPGAEKYEEKVIVSK